MPWLYPNLDKTSKCVKRASCLPSLNRLEGVWQVHMDKESDEAFTMVTQ